MYDINDVILSLGGVDRILTPLPIGATDDEILAHLANNVEGIIPTLAQVKAQIPLYIAKVQESDFSKTVSEFENVIQSHLDAEANVYGYDNITNACSYSGAPNPFQAEAMSFVAWRGNVWAYCYQELAKVQAGTRPMPTIEQIISELPVRVQLCRCSLRLTS